MRGRTMDGHALGFDVSFGHEAYCKRCKAIGDRGGTRLGGIMYILVSCI